eukprot:577959_1
MSSPQDDGKTTTIQVPSDALTNDELKEKSAEVENVEIDEDELFHVYSGHKISGPHYPHDIMKMCSCGEISDVFWVIRGDDVTGEEDDGAKWCKVHLSHEDTEDNKQFKSTYPKLYNYVDSKLKAKQLKTFNRPMVIPNGTKSAVKGTKRCVKILGVILIIIFSIFIGLHALVPGCCGIILWFITSDSDSRGGKVAASISTVLTYSGLIIIPLIIVYVVLLDTVNADEWDSQIQSWMIAYIAWGVSSYVLMTFMVALLLVDDVSDFDGKNAVNQLYSGIFWIIGVDLGDVRPGDLIKGGDDWLLICCVLWVFPCLASLLPAAIIGFISNFILEEKFELKCNDEIQSDIENLCFDDGFGCCEVISSHDYSNMYGFMGGLASNILATWAIIRIVGFLMTSASRTASLYAKKKKKKK